MPKQTVWKPSKPVVFAWLLCMLMLGGEIVSGGAGNPMALVFYCFLPAALWMIAQEINGLKARVDQLEEARRASALPKLDNPSLDQTADKIQRIG